MGPSPQAQVVINGDDVYEDLLGVSAALVDLAGAAGFTTTRVIGARRFLPGPPSCHVYVLCTATGAFSHKEQEALSQRVAAGAGLLALHASNVFADRGRGVARLHGAAHHLIGSRFVSHGPEPHESVFWVDFQGRHALTRGLSSFTVDHEHYVLDVAPGTKVLAVRRCARDPQPVLYVRSHGRGRVCYFQLGHDVRAWGPPTARLLVARALKWCARGKATVDAVAEGVV